MTLKVAALSISLAITLITASVSAQVAPPLSGPKEFTSHGYAYMRPCEQAEIEPLKDPDGSANPDRSTTSPGPNTHVVYCGHPYVVHHFNLEDANELAIRDSYRAVFKNGKVYNADTGKLYARGHYFFVMDVYGNFYFFTKVPGPHGEPPIHHSSFFDGMPIPSGGDLLVVDGRVAQLGKFTGHYDNTGGWTKGMTYGILENARDALRFEGGLAPLP